MCKHFVNTYFSVQVFPIRITQIDDEFPKLTKNEGIKELLLHDDKRLNIITKDTLHVEDLDTDDRNIIYAITLQPRLGFLQLSSKQGERISHFNQMDINEGSVQYVLKDDDFVSTKDQFIFSVEDTKPNKLFNNIFKIVWSRFSFNSSFYNVSEVDGFLEVPVLRTGNQEKDSVVSCKVLELNPSASRESALVPIANEFLIFILLFINAFNYIHTTECSYLTEPVLSFAERIFRVNETGEYFHFPVTRKGDLRHELSVMCTTENLTAQGSSAFGLETGSDFKSRPSDYKSYITFPAGASEIPCSVKIIDDNLYEEEENFQLILSNAHPFGKLQNNSIATVIINGPNDVPRVSLKKELRDIIRGQKNITVTILREGVDVSKECVLFCGARLSTSSEENLLSLQEIKFKPFEKVADCQLPLKFNVDSVSEDEKIIIFLNNPVGCILSEQNILSFPLKKEKLKPLVEFSIDQLTVNEESGSIQIPIKRMQDMSWNSTIYCVTHDGTAQSRKDFEERYRNRKSSVINFSFNQKETVCTVTIYDDDVYEGKESFTVELVSHSSDTETVIGSKKSLVIEIIDPEDATVIQLEKSEFVVPQHIFSNNISTSTTIPVLRYGDASMMSKIRVSTIDGSASSGLDYYAKSKLLTFSPGERRKNLEIEILYNKRRNWAVSFTVILGPDEVINANIGNISRAIVRIASVQSTESLILPSVPLVISLLHFDNVTKGMTENPISGYPLICIT
ncbi:Extracellular matrix protein FRAS1, partial [Araneus ventricosus]